MPKEFIDIILIDLFIIAVPLLLYFFPPKNINSFYGYRTTRSTNNIENWRFSQRYFSKQWMLLAPVILVVQVLLIYFTDHDLKSKSSMILPISMALYFVGSFVCILRTEQKLKKLM
ncbi:SdpI family protein [Sphingobacterium chungjuense]|uniref:SdpI family protein n=1 Tax=Sphingobacterium chungjuense TaxID=2675553 RepID=UPI00140A73EA